ncbi:enterobactin ABC transporter permease [Camelimonas fluminis]|uniref:Iron chelate uptake ABC transporter family permease subunit n=1 Tax=Camelimonas fluminis TaxID=1576911 RepID=A0ABV7UJR5_9HYPH|nr:enterobactin ABC transporter permease [Camelimonas fluminis]
MPADLTASPGSGRSGGLILLTLLAIALFACAAFMTVGVTGGWAFVLQLRAVKLAALLLVGCAIALATVLFQTVSANRILTPSIMGFDALYILIQTAAVFAIGASGLNLVDKRLLFLGQAALMTAFAALLYRWLFTGAVRSLHLLLLAGVVLGMLFRSVANVLQRMIDPNEFVVLQDRFFASFNTVDTTLLGVATVIIAIAAIAIWRMRATLDVLGLGRDAAIALGVAYKRTTMTALLLVAVLTSTSTALVGPVAFFGLLVANMAYALIPSHRHALTLPAAALIAVICLVGGQTVLERVFAFNTALAIIVEFLGGIVFLFMLVRGAVR